jgi:hypothetical protein
MSIPSLIKGTRYLFWPQEVYAAKWFMIFSYFIDFVS